MNVEEQLREYRSTLDATTETAAAKRAAVVPVAPVIRIRPVRSLIVAAVAVAAAIAIAFAVVVGASHKTSTPPAGGSSTPAPATSATTVEHSVVVPSVVGMTGNAALEKLQAIGLQLHAFLPSTCTGRTSGSISAQEPVAGARVASGSQITLYQCFGVSVTTSLPVVVCDTVEATIGGTTRPPSSIVVPAPSANGDPRSGFADKQGRLVVVAPTPWTCAAGDGADGSASLELPADSGKQSGSTFDPGSPSDHDGLFAISDGACQGCTYAEICGIVPNADVLVPGFEGTCTARPHGETITPLANNVYRMEDPAGAVTPDAAISVLRFRPRTSTSDPSVLRATCAFQDQLDICTSLLNQFLAANP